MLYAANKNTSGFHSFKFFIAANARWKAINHADLLLRSVNVYPENAKIKGKTPDSDRLGDRIRGTTIKLLHKNFLKMVRKRLKKFKGKPVILILDYTHEPFYGDINSNPLWIHEYKPKKGCTGSFRFLGAHILQGRKKLFVDAVPISIFTNEVRVVKEIITRLLECGITIEVVLVDRGFANDSKILSLFNELSLRYLGLYPKLENVKKILLQCGRKAVIPFSVRGVKTTLIVRKTTNIDWTFVTNIELDKVEKYTRIYRKRWNIETGFSKQDEARIMTKSVLTGVRYFYFLVAMLLYNEWKCIPKKLRQPFRRALILVGDVVESVVKTASFIKKFVP